MNNDIPPNAEQIDREHFDRLARSKAFVEGPWVSSFGDGHGEPYMPLSTRRVWGVLPGQRPVFAESEGE